MIAPWRIQIVLVVLLVASSCGHGPIGLYGTDPDEAWNRPVEAPFIPLPVANAKLGAIVIKRFEMRTARPVGGQYEGAHSQPGSMIQGFASERDLALPLFETVAAQLEQAGCEVWRDHDPNPLDIQGPAHGLPFLVLRGSVDQLEMHTFSFDAQIHDGVLGTLHIEVLGDDGTPRGAFDLHTVARIDRASSADLLKVLGNRLAIALLLHLNTLPPRVTTTAVKS